MACEVLDKNNARNAIKNRFDFFTLVQPNKVTQEIINDRLKATNELFEVIIDKDGTTGYGFKGDTEKSFKLRVGEWVQQQLNKNASHNKPSPTGELKMEAGTLVHGGMQLIIDDLHNNKGADLSKIKTQFMTGFNGNFKADGVVFDEMLKSAKNILAEIYETQNSINKRTGRNDNVTIHTELILTDPIKDRAGTTDLVVVFSDATASIYDFKTSEYAGDLSNNLINWGKFEGYQIQMNDYSRMLQERYQVRGIRASRIVPMQINLEATMAKGQPTKYTRHITNLIHGTEFTRVMPTSAERTMNQEIDDLLQKQFSIIKSYQERIRASRSKSSKQTLIRKLDSVYNTVQDLLTTGQILDVVDAVELIKAEFDTRKTSLPEAPDFLTNEDLNIMLNEIRSYENIPNYLNSYYNKLVAEKADKNLIQSVKDITNGNLSGSINRIVGEIEELMVARTIEDGLPERYVTQDETGRKFIDSADMLSMTTATWGKLSSIQHPAFAYLYGKVRAANMKIDDSVKGDAQQLLDAEAKFLEWAKANGKSRNQAYEELINTNTKSRHLYARYTDELFGEEGLRAKAYEAKDAAFFRKYYELASDHTFMLAKLRVEFETDLKFKYRNFEPIVKGGKVVKSELQLRKEYDRRLAEFDAAHNPKNDAFWLNKMFISTGIMQLNKTAASQFESKQYKRIQSTPALAGMYNLIENLNEKYREMLGMGYGDLPNNFLAFVRTDMIEGLTQNRNVSDLFTFTKESFTSFFTTRQDDQFMGARDPNTGELLKNIPIFYTSNIFDQEGNVANDKLKSMDIVRSTILFSQMAHNFAAKSNMEYEILNMRNLMASTGSSGISHITKGRDGVAAFDHMAKKAITKIGLKSNEYDVFNKFVNYYLYGVKFEEMNNYSDFTLGPLTMNVPKTIYKLKQLHTKITLAFPLITSVSAGVAARSALEIEGSRGVLYNKKQLRASMRKLATNFDKMKAQAEFFNIYGRQVSAEFIQKSLSQQKSRLRKYGSTEGLLRPLTLVDEGADMVGVDVMLDNYTIKNKRLVRIKDEDRKTSNVTLRALLRYNEATKNFSIDGLTEDEAAVVRAQYQAAVEELNYRTKGTPNAGDVSQSDLHLGLSVLMHYKSWMPGLMRARFGVVRYDQNTMTIEMGRYNAAFEELKLRPDERSFVAYMLAMLQEFTELSLDVITLGATKTYSKPNMRRADALYRQFLSKNPHLADEISFEDFVELKRNQLAAFTVEIRILAMFLTMAFLLGGGDDKETDGQGWVVAKRVFNKGFSEMTFALNPLEYLRLVSNPIPLASLGTTFFKSITNGLDEIATDIGIKAESPYDKTPYFYYFSRLFPGVIQMRQVVPWYEEDERIKQGLVN